MSNDDKDLNMDEWIVSLKNIDFSKIKSFAEIEKENKEAAAKLETHTKKLDIAIGHRIRVIDPSDEIKKHYTDKRFGEFIGYEAIVLDFNDGTPHNQTPFYEYYYRVYFLDKKIRKIHDKGGNVFLNPYYVENLGEDKKTYQDYLDMIKQRKLEEKYRFGKCDNCETPLSYNGNCIRCIKPQPLANLHGAYDFFELIYHAMAVFPEKELIQDDLWAYFDWEYRFSNDSYQSIYFDEKCEDEKLKEVVDYIKNNFNIKNKKMLVYVSW